MLDNFTIGAKVRFISLQLGGDNKVFNKGDVGILTAIKSDYDGYVYCAVNNSRIVIDHRALEYFID